MQINELKAVSEQLQAKGLNIPLALLESAQTLLIQQEISLNPSVNDVVRLALLRTQNPQLSDPQIVELFLAAKQDSLSTKGGYGDAIALNIEMEVTAQKSYKELARETKTTNSVRSIQRFIRYFYFSLRRGVDVK
ncbi:hypothetical protein [Planktothrix agardhii]|jgi:hypothetical protein|uniref:hypothetical protein n=1 Tax=Planktothrix agardhii TaxID=1160 RepID=UPI001F483FF6|nr:hypothetical protein [Planktothrix agardhii]MCF3575202.1 hypothetical protein [Planktothrix agardhii 1812]MCF3581009.1 hypothetical protein [Planktothrix agardhii 1811]MCF3625611.1 hypothetical protein [Planktothrix agardhii 1801]